MKQNLISCRINMMVSSMDEALGFYCELLGLDLVQRYGNHYAEVKGPDLLIGLHPKSAGTTFGNNISIGFGVTAFDIHVKRLEDAGIRIKVNKEGGIRLAHFADTDGNALFLAERENK